jgi:ssDNA thymidine ADP-ribosyltransferase, DarT
MNSKVEAEVERRGVTRLCHLTPLRNLVHIATGDGLLSTQTLTEAERSPFTQQDLERWDQHPDHVCCSIEYPNAWYYRRRADADQLFKTWVVLTIDRAHLSKDDTLFSERNAAAAQGAYIRGGLDGFVAMYASSVTGSAGRVFSRSSTHLRACPTDNQAEVLVPRSIPIEDVQSVVVSTDEHASLVYAALEQIGGSPDRFEFLVAPELFAPYALSACISGGRRPDELVWRSDANSPSDD